jgi:hypothetical protein
MMGAIISAVIRTFEFTAAANMAGSGFCVFRRNSPSLPGEWGESNLEGIHGIGTIPANVENDPHEAPGFAGESAESAYLEQMLP